MNYEVVWLARAERDLARIWLTSRLRIAVELAAQAIDNALRADAMTAGESRSQEDVRVVIVWPFVADVQVNVAAQRGAAVCIRLAE
jgi:hypothetical protein